MRAAPEPRPCPAPPPPAGDLNETFVVGEVDEASKQLVKVTYEVRRREGWALWLRHGRCGGERGRQELDLWQYGVAAAAEQLMMPLLAGRRSILLRCLPRPTLQCLHKAIAICKPGVPYREIGEVITKHAKAHG